MRKPILVGAILILIISISLTVGAGRASAQGPAGFGASSAAQESAHAFNPVSWFKKDSGSAPSDGPTTRADVERKLTPDLQIAGLLPPTASLTDACASFNVLIGCLTALHASHNLGVNFICLRANVTGVHTGADVSGCKVADGDKAENLTKAIHTFKPDANAKEATKQAEQQAYDDLKHAGM